MKINHQFLYQQIQKYIDRLLKDMKNNSDKILKRSISPLIPQVINNLRKTRESTQQKKKSSSNNNYAKVMKQFETYAKQDNKRQPVIINKDQASKYRIVTEPVDDRILHLAKANLFNNSFVKLPKSRQRLDTQIMDPHIKFTLRTSNNSKQKIKALQCCRQCQKYKEDIQHLKDQINKIIENKNKWKNAEKTLVEFKQQLNFQLKNPFSSICGKTMQGIISDLKTNIWQLMKEVQNLGSIDYGKMLQLQVFTYEPSYDLKKDNQYVEIKELIDQLRQNIEGKVTDQDFEIDSNNRNIKMLRNLKSRLNNSLRQNLQLKMKMAIISKAQGLNPDSQDELKKIVEQVLSSYQKTSKIH